MSIFELRRQASMRLKEAGSAPYRTTLVFLLICYAVLIPFNLFSISYTYRILNQESGIGAIASLRAYNTFASAAPLLINLFSSVWDANYNGYALKIAQGSDTGLRALFEGLQLLGKLIWLTVQILFFTALWMCFFILPGFVAVYRYRFAYLILFDCPELSASQALNLSKQLTTGRKLELFKLDLTFLYYFIPLAACNTIINLPYFFEVQNPGMATDIRFYLLGTGLAMLLQFLFLPHQRTSLAAAYLDACRLDENLESLSE